MQPFLLSLSPLFTAHRGSVSHCTGLFPSTCALEPVRLCDSSLQLSLKYTQTRYALTYTLSRVVTFWEGGALSYYLFSENERILFWEEFNLTPAVAPDFLSEKREQWRIAQHTLARLIFECKKKSQLSWKTFRFNSLHVWRASINFIIRNYGIFDQLKNEVWIANSD